MADQDGERTRQRYSVITLFPELIGAFAAAGVVARAREAGLIAVDMINPRDFADDPRSTVDDAPYGGGPGMVMQVAPLRAAIAHARADDPRAHVVYLSPQGRRFDHQSLQLLREQPYLVLVAGRYEGIDERVLAHDIDAEWSVGDVVLSGGEIPAMLIIDALARQVPGVVGDPGSVSADSFADGLLDFPHYTRPEHVDGQSVPAVLTSGDHARIARWRREQQLIRTLERRPDLLDAAPLSEDDLRFLGTLGYRRGG